MKKFFIILVIGIVSALAIFYWYNHENSQGEIVNSFKLPEQAYNIKLSPDNKYIIFQAEENNYQLVNVDEKSTRNFALNKSDNSQFIGWDRQQNIALIKYNARGKTYKKTHENFLFLYNASSNKLDRLPSFRSVIKKQKRPFYFLSNGYTVYPYSDTYFYVVEDNASGKPSYLINSKTNEKSFIRLHKGRFPANVIFSEDGKVIAFEEKTISDENKSLGIRIYNFKSKRFISIPKLKGPDRIVKPLTISDDGKWLLLYLYKGNLESTPDSNKEWPLYAFDIKNRRLSILKTQLIPAEAQNINWLADNEHFIVLRKNGLYKYDLYKLLPRESFLDAFSQ